MRSSQSRRVDTVQNDAYCQEKRCVRVELVLVNLVDERRAFRNFLRSVLDKVRDDIFGVRVRLAVRDKRGEGGVRVLMCPRGKSEFFFRTQTADVRWGWIMDVGRRTIFKNSGSKLAPSAMLTTLVSTA